MRRKDFVALAVHREAELLAQDVEHFHHDFRRIARVGTYHEGAVPHQDLLLQTCAPDVGAGVVDVVAVRDARDHTRRELVEQILERIALVLAAPRRNRGVLCSGDRIARHTLAIVLPCESVGLECVRAFPVHQVRHAADARGLDRSRSAETEVVQLVVDELRSAVLNQVPEHDLLHLATLGGYRRRIPHHRQDGLEVLVQPVGLGSRVGVLDGHEHVLGRHDRAFRNGLDESRNPAAVLVEDVLPASTVEDRRITEVKRRIFVCFLDGVASNHDAGEVLLQVIL